MDNLTVIVRQDLFLNTLVYVFIWIVTMIRCYLLIAWIFFTKAVERREGTRTCAIERSLYGYNTTKRIILHIVTKNH